MRRVRVLGAARDFPPIVNFQRILAYGVRTAPVSSIAYIKLCAHVKNLAAVVCQFVWTHGNTAQITHVIGMGGAGLAAAVALPG